MGEGLMLCRLGGRGEVLLFLVSSLGVRVVALGAGGRREGHGRWRTKSNTRSKGGKTEKKQRVVWFAGSADSEIRTES